MAFEDEADSEQKQEFNLSLRDEGLFEEKVIKRPTRSTKRNNTKKTVKENSIISEEEKKINLNSNTKMIKHEKEKFIDYKFNCNNYNFEDFVKNIDNGNASIEKIGFQNKIQIINEINDNNQEDINFIDMEEKIKAKHSSENKFAKTNIESKVSAFNLNNISQDKKSANTNESNLMASKTFSFSLNEIPNQTIIYNNCNNVFNNDSRNIVNDQLQSACSLNIKNNNNENNNSTNQFGISSLKDKLSLKVVIPPLDKKIPNDCNTETLSVKENKENYRMMNTNKEIVSLKF